MTDVKKKWKITPRKRLTFEDRKVIETMFNRGDRVILIAEKFNRPRQTIYGELDRGTRYTRLPSGEIITHYYASCAEHCYEDEIFKNEMMPNFYNAMKSKVYQMVDDGIMSNREICLEIQSEFYDAPVVAIIYGWIKAYKYYGRAYNIDRNFSKLGDEAFVEGNFTKAIEYYENGVSLGDTYCMTGLAFEYASGRVVKQDLPKACKLYMQAAELGDAEAMWRVGECYAKGSGCEKDAETANIWWHKSAAAGNPTGMIHLAHSLEQGDNGERNLRQALYWYKEAAKTGHAYAIKWLKEHEKDALENLHADDKFTDDDFFQDHIDPLENLGIENKLPHSEIEKIIKTGKVLGEDKNKGRKK